MAVQEQRKEFRTDDLALAAFLNYRGRRHTRIERVRVSTCEWVFDYDDVIVLVDDYHESEADVNPRKYAVTLARVRNELLDMLGQRRNGGSSKR
jgi:hypothetical protein